MGLVALFRRFFSYPVLVLDPCRTGTQNVYAAKWDKWLVWYSHFRVDPLRQGLASSTIRGYYSAITTTLKQLGGGVSGALIVVHPSSEMSSEAFLLENLA